MQFGHLDAGTVDVYLQYFRFDWQNIGWGAIPMVKAAIDFDVGIAYSSGTTVAAVLCPTTSTGYFRRNGSFHFHHCLGRE